MAEGTIPILQTDASNSVPRGSFDETHLGPFLVMFFWKLPVQRGGNIVLYSFYIIDLGKLL